MPLSCARRYAIGCDSAVHSCAMVIRDQPVFGVHWKQCNRILSNYGAIRKEPSESLQSSTWCKPRGSTARLALSYPLYTSVFDEEGWRRNRNCSQFCSCESLTFQQLSTPSDFLRLNLKEFREENRVEHLVPNQIPTLIETY
jgi:hypothetical protein